MNPTPVQTLDHNAASSRLPGWLTAQRIPLLATAAVWLVLYAAAAIRYENFFSIAVFLNFLRDNAALGVAAVGLTFVILSGGIDLSVGAVLALTTVLVAKLVTQHGIHPLVVIPIALALGALVGAFAGTLITFFLLPPFLVTLAGLFLARGLALIISRESIPVRHPLYTALGDFSLDYFSVPSILFLATLAAGVYVAHFTRFGRAVYAIGGNENSALLMGLPVRRTKVLLYTLSGFCSALAGVVSTLSLPSGNANHALGLELEAIAAVVIGGTLLTGGVGYPAGTLLGVLILAIIQTAINFEGDLDTSWTRITTGALLLAFILLQKFIQSRAATKTPTQ